MGKFRDALLFLCGLAVVLSVLTHLVLTYGEPLIVKEDVTPISFILPTSQPILPTEVVVAKINETYGDAHDGGEAVLAMLAVGVLVVLTAVVLGKRRTH